ncbi:MAG TPA: sterol desaturase family protein [Acidimicrobiales bacterium]|nr:sterol desaturase family protein [Acidimicrobiales bacterium]
MRTLLTVVASAAVAFVLWSFMEYVLHRFAFHEQRGKNYGSREHLRHHASREYRLWKNPEAWVGVVLVGAGLGVGAGWLVNPAAGWGLGAGYVVAYFTYEAIHGIAHCFAPGPGTAAGTASTTSTTTSPSRCGTRASRRRCGTRSSAR